MADELKQQISERVRLVLLRTSTAPISERSLVHDEIMAAIAPLLTQPEGEGDAAKDAEIAQLRKRWEKLRAYTETQEKFAQQDGPAFRMMRTRMDELSAPAPPSEPKPERPPMLLAQIFSGRWCWFCRCYDGWMSCGTESEHFKPFLPHSKHLVSVDRKASDPAALAIYDADIAKGGGA